MPVEPDVTHPNVARMYDYFLGGGANFAADREAADAAETAWPYIRQGARIQRAFLGRAVRFLAQSGVDQFLDLGSGIPTVGNVHEIAHRHNPAARIAYVDYEPVAVHAARAMLDGDRRVSVTQVDIRKPDAVLSAPTVADLLDFSRPVAVLAVGILHFLTDADDPAGILAAYRDACPPGSYLAISQASQVSLSDEQVARFLAAYARSNNPALWRTVAEIRPFLDGYRLVDPGLVLLPLWRPDIPVSDTHAAESNIYGAVGTLPA
ncbi:MAG TPA: SAM-dependent methyltransferase [Pseudonocardiaceae bacterium]